MEPPGRTDEAKVAGHEAQEVPAAIVLDLLDQIEDLRVELKKRQSTVK